MQLEILLRTIEGTLSGKFFKSLETALINLPQDYRSIGKHILSVYKIFSNFTVNMINKLIKGQDISYVLNYL